MAEECRKAIYDWWEDKGRRGTSANAALLMDRFLRVPVKDKEKDTAKDMEKDRHPTARWELFSEMQRSLENSADVYRLAFERQKTSIQKPKKEGEFSTVVDSRLVMGLGGENVLETGITLNRTYGVPIIPGTALKGLASHYCDQVWGAREEAKGFKRGENYHKAIFGTTDDSGHIIFHDAWITPETLMDSLQPDVMTPHHGDYYSGRERQQTLTIPTL